MLKLTTAETREASRLIGLTMTKSEEREIAFHITRNNCTEFYQLNKLRGRSGTYRFSLQPLCVVCGCQMFTNLCLVTSVALRVAVDERLTEILLIGIAVA
jgi:hypothetical protein